MSMIQLPPGMTPEQYWASPAGKRAAEQQRRFAEEMKAKQGKYQGLPPGARGFGPRPGGPGAVRDFAIKPGRDYDYHPPGPPNRIDPNTGRHLPRVPNQGPQMGGQWKDGVRIGDAPLGPPNLEVDPNTGRHLPRVPQPIPMPGQAQSAQDPYASSTKAKGVNDIAKEIEGALAEMAPDLGDAERRLMAADLAREYRQQRGEAVRGMTRPAQPSAPDAGREWKWDGNKYEYTDTPEYQDRLAARQASRQSQEADQARRREQNMIQTLKNSRGMALQAERDKQKVTGQSGPLMREDLQDRIQRQNMAAQVQAYYSGQSKVPPPGMAQPIQPESQGTPYGSPREEEMYWELVNSGVPPAEAARRVREAFQYAPRPAGAAPGMARPIPAQDRGSQYGIGPGGLEAAARDRTLRAGIGPGGREAAERARDLRAVRGE